MTFDVALAASLVGLAVLGLHAASSESVFGEYSDYPRLLGYLATVTPLALLAFRRRHPLAVLLASSAAAIVSIANEIPELGISALGFFIAVYSAGAYGAAPWRNRVRWLCVLSVSLCLTWFFLFVDDFIELQAGFLLQIFSVLTNLGYFTAAWLMGDYSRERRSREIELVDRADQLERTRAENTRRALIDERVRIARELHDVVAHHVSVMGVQAGAARRVLSTRPEVAQESLASIELSSRQAVDELHRLLGFLRQAGEVETLAPSPTLDLAGALVDQLRRDASLDVSLVVQGDPRPLPPGVDVSAYRVVQEALTNTLKHAGPAARAQVTLRYGPTEIAIDVVDDGRGPGLDGPGDGGDQAAGHGLVGMRERASLHGAELRTGRRRGGGFEVRARFPLPPAAPSLGPPRADPVSAPAANPASAPGTDPSPAPSPAAASAPGGAGTDGTGTRP